MNTSKNSMLSIGDKITAINGIPVSDFYSLSDLVNNKNSFELTYIHNGDTLRKIVTLDDLKKLSFIKTFSYRPFASIKKGINGTITLLNRITKLFIELFKTGEVGKNISSPLRLVYDIGNSMSEVNQMNNILFTLQAFLTIMASISLTLGFINLIPIPVMDGGQILINFIAMIKKTPLKPSIIYGYQIVGVIIVLSLFIIGIGNDIFYLGALK